MRKKYDILMEQKHNKIVDYYTNIKNIHFIPEQIYEVVPDSPLNITFDIESYKRPDLIYFAEYNIYLGEVKGRKNTRNKYNAEKQVLEYYDILKSNGIDTIPFTVLDYYASLVKPCKYMTRRCHL